MADEGDKKPPSNADEAIEILAAHSAKAVYEIEKARSSRISRAPAPSPRIDPNSGPMEPPKSRIDHDREDREHRRASLEAAFEQHSTETPPLPPAPPDPTIHGPEGPLPRTWREAVPYLVWVVLILGFGLECVAHLLKGDWLQALFAFLGMVGLAAMMLHWTQIRGKFSDTRWLVAAAMLLLLGLILSPFVEERRWPFSAWFVIAPLSADFSQQEVDAKISNALANLNAQLIEANRQKEIAMRDAEALRKQIQNAPPPPRPNYDEPRVYATKTITDLRGFYKDRTALQGNAFMADEIGKWIRTQGTIQFIRPDGLVFLDGEGGIISCEFHASWNPKLSAFRSGETMKVVGKIGTVQIGATPIYLQPCEIRD